MPNNTPERIELAAGLDASRIVTGLWQVADMERGGVLLDPVKSAAELASYAAQGFDTFDMADHYGSAEIIVGEFLRSTQGIVFTKWCPQPGAMTREVVRAGVQERLDRLGVQAIDLLQLHWWAYEHPAYLDAFEQLARLQEEGLVRHLGVTNFNTDHLRVLIGQGFQIATNQVCLSLLDRRALLFR